MRRVGFQLRVAPDQIEEYKRRHAAVWPDMREALSRSGWHNYSIFLRPDGLLFGYVEVPQSLSAAQAAMASEEVNARWQTWMADLFADNADGTPADQMMLELEEIFHLD
ncbi:MAG: L-rhamnose mutarotase [Propionibacteriaceae bacterium]|nr:L-rhamnose mutarotase [Propionibacteriaceae bacterium]